MKALIYIILFSFVVIGCRHPMGKKKQLDCEVPKNECKQVSWNGTPIDTSYNAHKNFYYEIKQVKGLNTSNDEHGITFFDKKSILTITNSEQQRTFNIIRNEADDFTVGAEYLKNSKGNVGFPARNGSEIFFASTSDQEVDKKDEKIFRNINEQELISLDNMIGRSRIFRSENETNFEKLNTNIREYRNYVWESHPAYDIENDILFFSSDRVGGYGGTDIWYMIKDSEGWSEPINCGANINTECDDISPYVSPTSNKLYFSTTGRESVGGYDIFHIDYYINKGRPVFKENARNMGAPINTEYDEIFPSTPNYDDEYFYYSSDQDGDFDIYVFQKVFKEFDEEIAVKEEEEEVEEEEIPIEVPEEELVEPEIDTIAVEPMFKLEGEVVDQTTQKPIPDIDVTARKTEENNIYKQTKTDTLGKYEFELEKGFEYEVKAEDDTLFYDSYKLFVDENSKDTVIKKDLALDVEKTLRINFKFDKYDDPYKYVLDSLGNEINTTWKESLDDIAKNLKKSEKILDEVILIGHTDPVGSNAYNIRLAQNRAEFVVNKLVERGVPIYLLKIESRGEEDPLERLEGESENQYHKRLRRVTLKKKFIEE